MSAGLPVVGPDRTAPPEFVDDRSGVLVPPDDMAASRGPWSRSLRPFELRPRARSARALSSALVSTLRTEAPRHSIAASSQQPGLPGSGVCGIGGVISRSGARAGALTAMSRDFAIEGQTTRASWHLDRDGAFESLPRRRHGATRFATAALEVVACRLVLDGDVPPPAIDSRSQPCGTSADGLR